MKIVFAILLAAFAAHADPLDDLAHAQTVVGKFCEAQKGHALVYQVTAPFKRSREAGALKFTNDELELTFKNPGAATAPVLAKAFTGAYAKIDLAPKLGLSSIFEVTVNHGSTVDAGGFFKIDALAGGYIKLRTGGQVQTLVIRRKDAWAVEHCSGDGDPQANACGAEYMWADFPWEFYVDAPIVR